MKYQEKKYLVVNFDAILAKLRELKSDEIGHSISTHYYTKRKDNNVLKLVEKAGKFEIHELTENDGNFTLNKNITVESKQAGLEWLKNQGFADITVIKMEHTDYEYRGGIIGLYTINDNLRSVILDFPVEMHQEVAEELGLASAEVIKIPYNKYLESVNQN